MKYILLFLALLFAAFAALQYNDPDPLAWMTVYGMVAALAAFAAFGRYSGLLTLAGLAVVAIWMALLVPEVVNWIKLGGPNIAGGMHAETPYIEFMREFIGLLLCGAALLWIWKMSRKAK
jgi:hypothetical protein